jgi:DNA-binding NtrC family response regulator
MEMADLSILNGKKVLIVDDESDIIESIEDQLNMCDIQSATTADTAKKLIESEDLDIVVLDIMGVNGYELLSIANEKGITAVMLTAHALTPDNFAKAMDEGACAYLPKDNLHEIDVFIAEILEQGNAACGLSGKWFGRLIGYFEEKFGPDWLNEYEGPWH